MTDADVIAAVKDILQLGHDWIADHKAIGGWPDTGSGSTLALIRRVVMQRQPVRLTRVSEPIVTGSLTTYNPIPDLFAGEWTKRRESNGAEKGRASS